MSEAMYASAADVLERGIAGHVKWYSLRRRYGFIERADGGSDVFVHQSAIDKSRMVKTYLRTLRDGEEVMFDIVKGNKGPQAAAVSGPGGADVRGSPHFMFQFYRFRKMVAERNHSDDMDSEHIADKEEAPVKKVTLKKQRKRERKPPQPENAKSEADGANLQTMDAEPQPKDATPQAEEPMPKPEEAKPQAKEPTPKPVEAEPQAEEPMPKPEEPTPQPVEVTPEAEEATPEAEEATPEAEEATPEAEEATPEAEEATPEAEEATPPAKEATPQSEEATPQTKEDTAQANEVTPEAKDVKHHPKDAKHHPKDAKHHPKDAKHQPKDAKPHSKDTKTHAKDVKARKGAKAHPKNVKSHDVVDALKNMSLENPKKGKSEELASVDESGDGKKPSPAAAPTKNVSSKAVLVIDMDDLSSADEAEELIDSVTDSKLECLKKEPVQAKASAAELDDLRSVDEVTAE
uniref:CSD_1 domain-containing protein n=1 Tax=Steinernema glaseri TaxID=37863 RepID=A0A1I7Y5E8_9BILA